MNNITDIILKSMGGGYAYLTLILICIIVIVGSFVLLTWLLRRRMASYGYPLPKPRGPIVVRAKLLFENLSDGAVWYLGNLPYVVAVVGIAIVCWGLTFSIVSGDPFEFARSGALVTLLGFVIAFLKSSYAEGVYQAEKSVDPERAARDRFDIVARAEGMASIWGVLIIIPGTLIWGYGDLMSKKVEKHACDCQWRLAVHYCLPKPPPPPAPPQRLWVLFDWNSATLQPAAEEIILGAARDAKNDANTVM